MTAISHIPSVLALKSLQPQDQQQMLRDLAKVTGQPSLRAITTVTSPATYTIQVVNIAGKACTGYFELSVYVATSPGGAPQNAQTENWTAGTVISTVLVNGWWRVLTDSTGKAAVTLAGAGGAARYIHASLQPPFEPSAAGNPA